MTMNENDENRMLSFEEDKQLAIEMWEFVRLCQTDLCTGYDATSLKRKFLKMKKESGVIISWSDNCILCDHCASCLDCPLYEIGNLTKCCDDDSPYDIVEHPDKYQYYEIDEAIDKIISAIHELEE